MALQTKLIWPALLLMAGLAGSSETTTQHDPIFGNGEPPEFTRWLTADSSRQLYVDRFKAFLERNGVADILPTSSLLISDRHYVGHKCPSDPFVMPPEAEWPNIVPTLEVVRTHVVPAIGPVQIVSGYRNRAFNACLGGATRSTHLVFGAFDFVPATAPKDVKAQFRTLCKIWRAAPPSTKIGLGAYYRKDRPELSLKARFHIDTRSRRTWGFGFKGQSSFCFDPESY